MTRLNEHFGVPFDPPHTDPAREVVDPFALAAMRAKPAPVEIRDCWCCDGDGWREERVDASGIGHGRRCWLCGGTGRLASDGKAT